MNDKNGTSLVNVTNQATDPQEAALFPIGTVSEQTGVNTVTLRAWERRYGLLQPRRTPKGHRLYSPQDIERIKQVLTLLEQGIPVGRVHNVLNSQTKRPVLVAPNATAESDNPWQHYYHLLLRWIQRLDTRSLEQAFNEATSLYSLELVARKLLLPLYRQLQQQRDQLPATAANHSFLHEFLYAKLSARYLYNNSRATNGKQLLMLNTQSGLGQIEALLHAAIISQHGYQLSLLGNGIQLNHLPLVLEHQHFDALFVHRHAEDIQHLPSLLQLKVIPTFVNAEQAQQLPNDPKLPLYTLPEKLTEFAPLLNETLLLNPDSN